MKTSLITVICGLFCLSLSAYSAEPSRAWMRVEAGGDMTLWAADGSHRLPGSVAIDPAAQRGPISPDGTRLAYIESHALMIADKGGRNARRLSPAGYSADWPRWSPDGKKLAFLATKGEPHWQVYVIDADGQNLRQLTDSPAGAWNPQFGPDGRLAYLLYAAPREKFQRCALMIRDINDANTQSVTIARDIYISNYAQSPDGKSIAYATIGALVYHDLGTEKEARIEFSQIDPRIESFAAYLIAWRPDGASVACTITFAGDRQQGGPKMLGDEEVFLLPREGQSTWFSVGARVDQIIWEQPKAHE